MTVFKCKMCGGSLEIQENTGIAVCEYCGSEQTIPRGDDDVRTNLFNRANNLRLKCEFDKAQQVYDKILNADNTDAEAHWGVVLCKYGIEYVEDPKTHKRIPTCHRTQYESVLTDVDYLAAIENADATQRGVYTTQALDISRLQKDILAIVEKEKPFDVFLCYKETDENGKRTVDSSLANDIYYQLTNEGLKVFYAAITLEDKLGQEYEPYIFAALHSAKVMLVIGTKPEYFESVWVRNEWSRFLGFMKTDRSKLLIPCYRDMDAYDLPEEFSHLQAQDMSKIGFVNDVVRGIRKVVSGTASQTAPAAAPTVSNPSNVSGLLERAFLFLEDGKWQEADEYCEKVLDNSPKCAEAYLGKLMAELQINKRENLKDAAEPFDTKDNCQKASRFDAKIAQELADANAYIRERNLAAEEEAKRAAEESRKEDIYRTACEIASNAVVISSFEFAIEKFDSIPGYKDARQRADECRRKIEDLKIKQEKEEAERKQREAEAVEATRIATEKRNAMIKKVAIIGTPIVAVLIVFLIVLNSAIIPNKKYKEAQALEESGSYEQALTIFVELDHYKDSAEKINEMHYNLAKKAEKENNICAAALEYGKAGHYKDAFACALRFHQKLTGLVVAGNYYTAGLTNDGRVIVTDFISYDGQWWNKQDVYGSLYWSDITALVADVTGDSLIGVRADGTVVADGFGKEGQYSVSGWTNIISAAANLYYSFGVCANGSVVVTSYTGDSFVAEYGQNRVSNWSQIVSVAAGSYHTIGLRSDGKVIATEAPDDSRSNCGQSKVSDWTDIVAIAAGDYHTIGLRADGTVFAAGKNDNGQCDVSDWTDIVAIAAGEIHTVGLRADGTVVTTGDDSLLKNELAKWTNIIAIATSGSHTVGLRSDGTVVATGDDKYGQCDVDDWENMKIPTIE